MQQTICAEENCAVVPLTRTFHVDRDCSVAHDVIGKRIHRKNTFRIVSEVHDGEVVFSAVAVVRSSAECSRASTLKSLSFYSVLSNVPNEDVDIEQFSSRIDSFESHDDLGTLQETEDEQIDIRLFMSEKALLSSPGEAQNEAVQEAGEDNAPIEQPIAGNKRCEYSRKNGQTGMHHLFSSRKPFGSYKHAAVNGSGSLQPVHSPGDIAAHIDGALETDHKTSPTPTDAWVPASIWTNRTPTPAKLIGNGSEYHIGSTDTDTTTSWLFMNRPFTLARKQGSLSDSGHRAPSVLMDEWDALDESTESRTVPSEESVASVDAIEPAPATGVAVSDQEITAVIEALPSEKQVEDEVVERIDLDDAFDNRFAAATTEVDEGGGSIELYVKSGFVQPLEASDRFIDGIIPWFGVPTKEHCDAICLESFAPERSSRFFGAGRPRPSSWGLKVKTVLSRNTASFPGGRRYGGTETEARRSSFAFGVFASNSWRKRLSEYDNFSDY